MPNQRRKLETSYREVQIQLALGWLDNQSNPNVARAAERYNVDYQALRRRWNKGVSSRDSRGGHNKALTIEQEAALDLWISRRIALGRPPRPQAIVGAAQEILQLCGNSHLLSRHWYGRWKKRKPEYHTRRSKPLSKERDAANEKQAIEAHFQAFQKAVEDNNITPSTMWNVDETGFRIGCLAGQLVLTYIGNKTVYMADPKNRELITSVECINASRLSIQPMVIMAGKQFKERLFDNNLDNNVLFALSENAYITGVLAIEWIKHFERLTQPIQVVTTKRLLIMDGHESHLTYEFITYCYNHHIVPFLLPPHSTHLLQPLDVGVFQSVKHYHQQVLEREVRIGGADFQRADFLACLQEIRSCALRSHTIRNAWVKVGLNPLDPTVVLERLTEMALLVRAQTPDCNLVGWDRNVDFEITPKNVKEVAMFSEYITSQIEEAILGAIPISSTLAIAIEKREKANKSMILSGLLAEKELADKAQAEQAKIRRKEGSRIVQKYGVIQVGDARLSLAVRNKEEEALVDIAQKKKQRVELERSEKVARRTAREERLQQESQQAREKREARAKKARDAQLKKRSNQLQEALS